MCLAHRGLLLCTAPPLHLQAGCACQAEMLWQEVKTVPALSVLQYSCSARTMALHTGELNARR